MTKTRHLGRLFVLFTGLLLLSGCELLGLEEERQPTLAALLASPTPVAATLPAPSVTRSTPQPRVTQIPSPTPQPSLSPTPIPFPWLLAYDSDVEGNDEIYLLPADGGSPVNLTRHLAEDRHPAWSPDGRQVAFQSDRHGNWEIYTLDWQSGALTRLTFDQAYDGAPAWSPDGAWIVFESYRDTVPCSSGTPVPNPPFCPDLALYRVPAQGGAAQRLTAVADSPQGNYQPAWSPDGDWIAFTSWRDGDKEVYVIPSGGGPAQNVTRSAGDDWSPAWSPDGQALIFISERAGVAELYLQPLYSVNPVNPVDPLDSAPAVRLTFEQLPPERPTSNSGGGWLFARYDPGPAFEAHDPYRPGTYHLYHLSLGKDGRGGQDGRLWSLSLEIKARRPAVAPRAELAAAPTFGSGVKAQARAYPAGDKLALRRMEDVDAPDPRLVEGVDDAFRAWRAAVHARSGYDFLGRVSDIFRPAAYYHHYLGYLSWHKTGRAVDLLFDWRDAEGKDALYVVREDLNGQVYWRLFLKCAQQDGSMGEPLTRAPWYFWWHTAPPGHPEEVENGGQRLPIPAGYFVDVTALAERYGWSRIASFQLEDFHWQRDSTATEYWHYQHTDGLTWYQAMAQIYPSELLAELFSRPVAAERGQSPEVMDGKGLPLTTATAAP